MNNFQKYKESLDVLIDSQEDAKLLPSLLKKMVSLDLVKEFTDYVLERNLLTFNIVYQLMEKYFVNNFYDPNDKDPSDPIKTFNLLPFTQKTEKTTQEMVNFFLTYLEKEKINPNLIQNYHLFFDEKMNVSMMSEIIKTNPDRITSEIIKVFPEFKTTEDSATYLSKVLSYSCNIKSGKINFPTGVINTLKERLEAMLLDKFIHTTHLDIIFDSNFSPIILEKVLQNNESGIFFNSISQSKSKYFFRAIAQMPDIYKKWNEFNFNQDIKTLLILCINNSVSVELMKEFFKQGIKTTEAQSFIRNILSFNSSFLHNALNAPKAIALIELFQLPMPKSFILDKGHIVLQNEAYLNNYYAVLEHFNCKRLHSINTIINAININKATFFDVNKNPEIILKKVIKMMRPLNTNVKSLSEDEKDQQVIKDMLDLMEKNKIAQPKNIKELLEKIYFEIKLSSHQEPKKTMKL